MGTGFSIKKNVMSLSFVSQSPCQPSQPPNPSEELQVLEIFLRLKEAHPGHEQDYLHKRLGRSEWGREDPVDWF